MILIFLLVFFTTAIGVSQALAQGVPSEDLKEVARETTEMWTRELDLTQEQADMMEKTIIAFAMKKHTVINSKMREEAKTRKLRSLQAQEHQEIQEILTKPQFAKYLSLTEKRIKNLQQSRNKQIHS